MNRLYREVSVKDRKPIFTGYSYRAYFYTDKGLIYYDKYDGWEKSLKVVWWLEEVKLPSDDEIEKSGREGGLRDNELQLYWEGAVGLKRSIIGNTNQESEVTNG